MIKIKKICNDFYGNLFTTPNLSHRAALFRRQRPSPTTNRTDPPLRFSSMSEIHSTRREGGQISCAGSTRDAGGDDECLALRGHLSSILDTRRTHTRMCMIESMTEEEENLGRWH
jgi:hypothetical protein